MTLLLALLLTSDSHAYLRAVDRLIAAQEWPSYAREARGQDLQEMLRGALDRKDFCMRASFPPIQNYELRREYVTALLKFCLNLKRDFR